MENPKILNDDNYHCVMIFQRKKDIPTLQKSTMCIFQDFCKLSHIKEKISMYQTIAKDRNARVYFSINPRDMRKAKKDLLIRLIETDDRNEEVCNIQAQLYSSLMRCPIKEEKRFIVDVDNNNEDSFYKVKELIEYEIVVKTKNGWHVICKPFDIRIVSELDDVEIKKDGMTDISILQQLSF